MSNKKTNATDKRSNGENNKSRSPSSTPSSIYSQASSSVAKSPSTPLSTPPSEEADKFEPGEVRDEEAKEIEVFFSCQSCWVKLIIDDQQGTHRLRKRKAINDDVEMPMAKRPKVGHHLSLLSSRVDLTASSIRL